METIQRKVDGHDITTDIAPDSGSKIIDLMDALKASLAATAKADADAAEQPARKGRKAS